MPVATVTSKGQVTIPKEIRDRLKVQAGDQVLFHVRADGKVLLRARNVRLADLGGTVKTRARVATVEDMDRAAHLAAAKANA